MKGKLFSYFKFSTIHQKKDEKPFPFLDHLQEALKRRILLPDLIKRQIILKKSLLTSQLQITGKSCKGLLLQIFDILVRISFSVFYNQDQGETKKNKPKKPRKTNCISCDLKRNRL